MNIINNTLVHVNFIKIQGHAILLTSNIPTVVDMCAVQLEQRGTHKGPEPHVSYLVSQYFPNARLS